MGQDRVGLSGRRHHLDAFAPFLLCRLCLVLQDRPLRLMWIGARSHASMGQELD